MQLKADKDEVVAMELRLGSRITTLEAAILKGLKVISDKVSQAPARGGAGAAMGCAVVTWCAVQLAPW